MSNTVCNKAIGEFCFAQTAKIRVARSRVRPSDWDSFAALCSGSYRCSYKYSIFNNPQLAFLGRLKRYEIFLEDGSSSQKVGQCVLVFGFSFRLFCDQLQLLPSATDLWSSTMQELLRALGPGRYRYGSEWSIETPRDADLAQLLGVSVINVRRSYLEAVEFHQWPDWDAYWRSVSENIRRNVKKAREAEAHLEIKEYRSYAVLRHLSSTSAVREETLANKSVRKYSLMNSLRTCVKAFVLIDQSVMTIFRSKKGAIAFSYCVEFGPASFYLEGGSRQTDYGVRWLTLVQSIRRAYERSNGLGLFVMGPVDDETINKPEWQGLALSRRHCRVTQRPVATVDFRYCEADR